MCAVTGYIKNFELCMISLFIYRVCHLFLMLYSALESQPLRMRRHASLLPVLRGGKACWSLQYYILKRCVVQ